MSICDVRTLNNGVTYQCVVEEGIVWETGRRKTVGKLTFTVIKDAALNIQEGNPVIFRYKGEIIFYGFIFTKERSDNVRIKVTAYDMLRYLKNKDTYVYTNKTAAALLKMIISDFKLNYGHVVDTKHVIKSGVEENKELFEVVQNALDETLQKTGVDHVVFSDHNGINLQPLSKMKLDFVIDEENAETYSYTTSIDSETYNKIKLVYEDKEKGKREVYIVQNSATQKTWGVLQYFEVLQDKTNVKQKADVLLSLYNKKQRKLNIKGIAGQSKARAGTLIPVKMNLGDITVANYMIVDTAKHTFNESHHTMDLTFVGGDFVA